MADIDGQGFFVQKLHVFVCFLLRKNRKQKQTNQPDLSHTKPYIFPLTGMGLVPPRGTILPLSPEGECGVVGCYWG